MAKQKKNRWLLVVSILAYIIFLLVLLPVNVLYKLTAPQNLPVEVVNLNGTLWSGQAALKHKMVGTVDATWSLSPTSLLVAQASLNLSISTPESKFTGEISASPSGLVTIQDGEGYISGAMINKFLRKERVTLNADVELSGIDIAYNLNDKQAQAAAGRLVFQGGEVSFPVGRKNQSAEIPMLIADLKNVAGALIADVTTTDGLAVANASVKPDGWAGVAIKQRLVDLAGQKLPNKAQPDTTIFEVSKQIF